MNETELMALPATLPIPVRDPAQLLRGGSVFFLRGVCFAGLNYKDYLANYHYLAK